MKEHRYSCITNNAMQPREGKTERKREREMLDTFEYKTTRKIPPDLANLFSEFRRPTADSLNKFAKWEST